MERNIADNNEDIKRNQGQQGVDKAPGEEEGKGEPVSKSDLKGKKVDADPGKKEGRPSH